MLISGNTTTFMQLLLLCTLSFAVVHGQQVTSYAIGFFHGNTSLPATRCETQFYQVRNSIYAVYFEESTTDMNFDSTTKNKIRVRSGGRRRNLLRSSSTKVEDDAQDHDSNIDNEERTSSTQRQLQDWCYKQCTVASRTWLQLNGCSTECRLTRRLGESMTSSEDESTVNYEDKGRELQGGQSGSSNSRGSRTNILTGQGDTSAAQFYASVPLLIPSTDSCRNILLNMTYVRFPMIIKL